MSQSYTQTSFEFLSSFEEWERETLRQRSTPRPPDFLQEDEKIDTWSTKIHILNTLKGYDGMKQKLAEALSSEVNGIPRNHSLSWKERIFTPQLQDMTHLPKGSCLIKIQLKLQSPFYSRDDRHFYPTENALKRQWAFHVPYLAAAGIKGLLSWAYRMTIQNAELDERGQRLFGLANDADSTSFQGCVHTYPLFWEGSVGLDIINPQNRSTGAGTVPVKYEVVQRGATGDFYLLLTAPPAEKDSRDFVVKHLPPLLDALAFLLQSGGLSAKKTADWGNVDMVAINAAMTGIDTPVSTGAGTSGAADTDAMWAKVEDAEGKLIPYDEKVFVGKLLKNLLPGWSNKQIQDRDAAYAAVQERHAKERKKADASEGDANTAASVAVPVWLFGEKGIKSLDHVQEHLLTLLKAEA